MLDRKKVYYLDLLERTVSTFIQGFIVAAFVVAGVSNGGDPGSGIGLPAFDQFFSLTTLQGGLVGGAIALMKGLLASGVGSRNSAAFLPSPPDFAPGEAKTDYVGP